MDTCGYGVNCPPPPPPPPGHLLPFTGGEVWLLVAVGLLILVAGLTMAWAARRG